MKIPVMFLILTTFPFTMYGEEEELLFVVEPSEVGSMAEEFILEKETENHALAEWLELSGKEKSKQPAPNTWEQPADQEQKKVASPLAPAPTKQPARQKRAPAKLQPEQEKTPTFEQVPARSKTQQIKRTGKKVIKKKAMKGKAGEKGVQATKKPGAISSRSQKESAAKQSPDLQLD